jgi:dimeric dUTPase (all-alpha-NTP-PPase superfamily)
MNWLKLFKLQKELDNKIGYEGEDRLTHKFSALLVEAGEAWNETRDFKFWSKKYKKPNIQAVRVPAMMEEDKQYFNPLLDELSDMHHFIMSIGIEIQEENDEVMTIKEYEEVGELAMEVDISVLFKEFISAVLELEDEIGRFYWEDTIEEYYEYLVKRFLMIVKRLGFTTEDLERAYYEKNAINHERQVKGY